jgi:leader peptidase (prepilin peptidase)/N-methyltransferase
LAQRQISTRTIIATGIATGALLTVASAATANLQALFIAVLCAATVFIVLGIIWLVVPRSLGFGDVRLATVSALMLGWWSPLLVAVGFVAAQAGCLASVAGLALAKRVHRDSEIPLGAFIAVASIGTVLLFGR